MTSARSLSGPFDYRLPALMAAGAVDVGSMLVVPFGRREILGVVVGVSESSEVSQERLLEPLRALEPGVEPEMVALARWVAHEYCSTFARALSLVLPPEASRRLSGRRRGGAAARAAAPDAVQAARASPREHARTGAAPSLSAEQRAALDSIEAALRERRSEGRLVHGVTGSGKTEVYMRAAAIALEQGRGVIVLVPEIALAPQITTRFIERFGDTVAVLHSRLRPAQRYAEWRRLREGEARVCVGPRSAVFAPVGELGLVVVDEEHDASYKHEGDPRYDARDVAAQRARRAGALLLLGSATPRAESAQRLPTVRMAKRIDGRPLPAVDVLDMREEAHGLHPRTAAALAQVRAAGEKAIVLLNRRGWSNFLSCRSCGHVWSCPACDVALVLHRASGLVACHHCGHREQAPERCPACSSTSVARHGAGTERLASELARALDDGSFPIFRLDADTFAAPPGGTGADVLERFARAPCGALIGTQMVAKGHDFQDVTLGVVLDADATLRFPDFRAEERTFALIAQLAGRVGRGGAGSVLVQTIAPDARSIAHAARHDSEGFLAGELARRRALSYPPFSHLVRVTCSATSAQPARAAAQAVRALLPEPAGRPGGEAQATAVLGPAALFRLRGRERQTLLVKASNRAAAVRAIGAAVAEAAAGRVHAGVSFSVDVEPH